MSAPTPALVHEVIHWLAATPASSVIQRTFWLVPVVQTVHLLAIGIVIASGGMLGLRLLGWAGRAQTIAQSAARLIPWIWRALAVLLASGLVLIVGEPARTLGNPAFWAKIVSLSVAVVLLAGLQRSVRRDPAAWSDDALAPLAARWIGASTVLLWVAVLTFGRWIAYVLEA